VSFKIGLEIVALPILAAQTICNVREEGKYANRPDNAYNIADEVQ
jgi:hypothetical protein